MEETKRIECTSCEHKHDEFGNFVSCTLSHSFVDYWYWNGTAPDDCPLKKPKK